MRTFTEKELQIEADEFNALPEDHPNRIVKVNEIPVGKISMLLVIGGALFSVFTNLTKEQFEAVTNGQP